MVLCNNFDTYIMLTHVYKQGYYMFIHFDKSLYGNAVSFHHFHADTFGVVYHIEKNHNEYPRSLHYDVICFV
jgi:hypothetical protein